MCACSSKHSTARTAQHAQHGTAHTAGKGLVGVAAALRMADPWPAAPCKPGCTHSLLRNVVKAAASAAAVHCFLPCCPLPSHGPTHLQACPKVCAPRHRLQHRGPLLLALLRGLLQVCQHALGCRAGGAGRGRHSKVSNRQAVVPITHWRQLLQPSCALPPPIGGHPTARLRLQTHAALPCPALACTPCNPSHCHSQPCPRSLAHV